jgi:hypothetical protein
MAESIKVVELLAVACKSEHCVDVTDRLNNYSIC